MPVLVNVALAAASVVGAASGTGVLVNQLSADHGVPERAAVAYLTAARNAPCPLDYRILTAIGAVESGHGTHGGSHLDPATGEASGSIVSSQGASGPMQFMPATWAQYATDGNGDGVADINNIDDAAASSAKLLCSSNVDKDLEDAVGSYNGGGDWRQYSESQNYVAQVDDRIAALPADDGSPSAVPVGQQAKLPSDKGRICGLGEVFTPDNKCLTLAQQKAAYLWAQLGQLLGKGDTPKLHNLWSQLNGAPPATTGVQTQQVSQSASSAALSGDLAGLPGSRGLQTDFAQRLLKLAQAAPGAVTITSGYRSTAEQVAIIESHGGECGYMVACVVDGVCKSMHCQGEAADMDFGDGLTDQWAHANLDRFGLCQPMSWESWHIQPKETC